jgi:hypothetical protein
MIKQEAVKQGFLASAGYGCFDDAHSKPSCESSAGAIVIFLFRLWRAKRNGRVVALKLREDRLGAIDDA